MTDRPAPSFDLLAAELVQDPDLDVSVTDTGLHVHGRLFAYLDGAELVVDLPQARADD